MKTILYTAAHSGFDLGQVPLGGGAAIGQALAQSWTETKPFPFRMLGPEVLGIPSPRHKDLVHYSALQYASFCRRFERAVTEAILQYDPRQVVVLCNDVSEGPDFKTLARKGYTLFTLYHVDVVDYVTRIYLRGLVRPEWTTAAYRAISQHGLSWLMPHVLKLIWKKQEASVTYSQGLVVPSQRMKSVLLACYPDLHSESVHVIPWGSRVENLPEEDITREMESYRYQYDLRAGSPVLLLLSRIAPEKGQHGLLEALALWEKKLDYPREGVTVILSGEAAYMMGKSYEKKLKKMAGRLRKTRVHFIGHTSGAKKQALFRLADLYVFPSIHESYGLTMMEALRAGLPVLTTYTHGACEIFQPEFGEMLPEVSRSSVPKHLLQGLRRLLSDRPWLKRMGLAGAAWAARHDFSGAASRLAALLASPSAKHESPGGQV